MARRFGIEHRARSNQNVAGRVAFRELLDRLYGAIEGEGDLHGGDAAFGAGGGNAAGLIGGIGAYDYDEAGLQNLVQIFQLLHRIESALYVARDNEILAPGMISFIGILILGFFLGMRHATDADHVIAVMTIVTKQRGVAKAGAIGALWGMGHTLTIFLVGTAIILFKVVIPPRLGLSMEFAVGLMLILLGVLNLTGVLRWLHDPVWAFAAGRGG